MVLIMKKKKPFKVLCYEFFFFGSKQSGMKETYGVCHNMNSIIQKNI